MRLARFLRISGWSYCEFLCLPRSSLPGVEYMLAYFISILAGKVPIQNLECVSVSHPHSGAGESGAAPPNGGWVLFKDAAAIFEELQA